MSNRKYETEIKNWRVFFSAKKLETAQNHINRGNVYAFSTNEDNSSASCFVGAGRAGYHPVVYRAPGSYSEDWAEECFCCTCQAANPRSSWWGGGGIRKTCSHEAALMLVWEQEHGPWEFQETEAEWQIRKALENKEKEEKRRQALKEKEEKISMPASSWKLESSEEGRSYFFNVPALLQSRMTDAYAIRIAGDFVNEKKITFRSEPELTFGSDGLQNLKCRFTTEDEYEKAENSFVLTAGKIEHNTCTCKRRGHIVGNYYYTGYVKQDENLCGHELAGLSLVWEYIKKNNPGDATDQTADRFLKILEDGIAFDVREEPKKEKKRDIFIVPRLLLDRDGVALTFKIGKTGGKSMILKGFRKLQEAIELESKFTLGKTMVIDFAEEDIEEESLSWLSYIFDRINDADRVSSRLASTHYGYYGREVAVQSNEKLTGAALDHFYELTEGMDLECEKKATGNKGVIHIGEAHPRLSLQAKGIRDDGGQTCGIRVEGKIPVILYGQRDRYAVTETALGKLSNVQWSALSPFQGIAGPNGLIDFRIGKNRLGEYYYRILPAMLDNPCVEYEDMTDESVQTLLPPEAEFTFRLDIVGKRCVLEAQVTYDDKEYQLDGENSTSEGYRDRRQEERVTACIKKYFALFHKGKHVWMSLPGDDAIYDVVDRGLEELGKYGTVLVTNAFSAREVRTMPPVGVQISVDGGLLDISVLSKTITREELWEIYNSYQLKKRYHRLKDGSFVSLDKSSSFEEVETVAKEMELSVEDLMSTDQKVPLYRALYLDHLLSEHEELVSSRDRTYRALIKSFHTIRDADYDVPTELENVLRPYQTYGHKWMRTVIQAGFGGILADEMGLGKTLESISVLRAMDQAEDLTRALVVCPASLVYNWEEEIHRFAPELKVECVAGNAAARKQLIGEIESDSDGRIYITSYDLLRADISMYKDIRFTIMLIDEAQYIKNTKAAMTKAVKVVKADRRMALTGTPIENRLSEMWSIFDYLMPGFLYDHETFVEKFEMPISKQKDQYATQKLKNMVSPFILRRKKEDVLKDLPPKLEEVRYARLEQNQKKIYDAQVLHMKGMLDESEGKGEDKIKILAELTKIRQICCDPGLLFEDYKEESAKRLACLELIKNAIGGGHRMLLFSQFTSMLDLLQKDLEAEGIPYYKIIGATPKDKRIQSVHAFNEGNVPVFLISLKAGGTGLNLTGADIVIHYDPWWNLAAQNQATDRAHRIGQEKTVTVYRLIAKDTIEEKILQLQEAKRDLAEAILSGQQTSLLSLSEKELLALLE